MHYFDPELLAQLPNQSIGRRFIEFDMTSRNIPNVGVPRSIGAAVQKKNSTPEYKEGTNASSHGHSRGSVNSNITYPGFLDAAPHANYSPQAPLSILAHGITPHVDALCVVDQTVENAVGYRRVTDLLVPAGEQELRGKDGRAHLAAVFADLLEVGALGF